MQQKNPLGQYFTTNITLKEKVCEFILNDPNIILEPSIGQGDLVQYIKEKNQNINFDMYEIDTTIKILKGIAKNKIIYGDFMKQKITKKYKTIIGNPPYIRTTKGNLYIDFIEKCYHLLQTNGELIFIIPSDFFKLTSASNLIHTMILNGTFTHIYHPHNERLFEKASIDIMVFRYCKNPYLEKIILINKEKKYLIHINGIITFSDIPIKHTKKISDYFDVYVGMVTGKESVYKNEKLGNITVLNGINKLNKYILVHTFPSDNNEINTYLLKHKGELINRKIRKFTEKNWFEWGALRNYKTILNNIGKKCIYVNNLTRQKCVAFEGTVQYFGGSLLLLIPKDGDGNCNGDKKIELKNVVDFINSETFKSNYMYSNRFKIGHRQLANSLFII